MDKITIQYHGVIASVGAWARLLNVSYYTLLARLKRGWSPEKAIEVPVGRNGGGTKTHGRTGSKEYRAWKSMIGRCYYQKYLAFDRYGGRGIAVCDRWRENFDAFYLDVGRAPSPQHSLGRIDNDGHYAPGNVAWQTAKEQARNRARPRRRNETTEIVPPPPARG